MAEESDDKNKTPEEGGSLPPAAEVIKAFGGLRPMANKMGIAVSTVQGWNSRGQIPEARQADVLKAAEKHGISLASGTEPAPKAEEKAEKSDKAPEEASAKPAVAASATQTRGSEAAKASPAAAQKTAPEQAKPAASPASSAGAARPQQTKGSALPGMILGAALLAGGFAIAVATSDQWQPLLGLEQDSGTGEKLAALSGGIAALDSKIAGLEAVVKAAPKEDAVSQDQIAALSGETDSLRAAIAALREEVSKLEGGGAASASALDALEGRLQDLENRAPAVTPGALEDLRSELASQDARLASLAEADEALRAEIGEAPAAGDVVLILALNELEEALSEGRDLTRPLALVRRLGGGDGDVSPVIETLSSAGDSLPTRHALAVRFQSLAQEIVAAGYGEEEEDSLLSGIIERLSRIVSIRPVGDLAGDGTASIVARAEAELEDLNLAGAVTELEALQGAPADAAAGWLATARSRLEAEAGLDRAIAALLERQAGEGN